MTCVQLRSTFFRIHPVFFTQAFSAIALACPVCHTQTGQQVRAGIFSNSFGPTLLLVVAPFPVFFLAVKFFAALLPNGSDENHV